MRKIFILTERRADYSRFRPILKLIEKDNHLDYLLAVTGAHLKIKMGHTIDEIINDGFRIDYKLDMFIENEDDSGAGMVRSFARVAKDITYILEESKPDIILAGFDIGANLAITIAGAHMNIPVAHIQGGEVTGTIDESIRHAMSKFSHFHFASNKDAVERLIKMGEKENDVYDVGCPSIDAILNVKENEQILKKYSITKEFFILIQHPVTSEINEIKNQIKETIKALKYFDQQVLVILPNNDAGFQKIVDELKSSNFIIVKSLNLEDYVNLLKRSALLIGNSSSGIHETSSFNIPTINIGTRQNGRLRPENVIDVDYDFKEIINAINEGIKVKKSGKMFQNPYGDGNSAKRIVDILKSKNLSKDLIQKKITY